VSCGAQAAIAGRSRRDPLVPICSAVKIVVRGSSRRATRRECLRRCSYTEIRRRRANRCPKDRRGADSHLQVRTGAAPHIVPRHACRGSIPPTRWFVHVCVGTANRLMQARASISARAAAPKSSSARVATAAISTAGKDAPRPPDAARNVRPGGATNQAVLVAASTPSALAATASGKRK
jgi:hypothetical protein